MLSVTEALRLILEKTNPLGETILPLSKALHERIFQKIRAPLPLPFFDHSAMDGFAVRSESTLQASEKNPYFLKVSQIVAAGDASQPLADGFAARIMTGAPLPEGADAVVPFEDVIENHKIIHPVSRGSHVRFQGEDVREGEELFESGNLLTPRKIALLAALGIHQVSVFQKPKVSLLITGNELAPIGTPLTADERKNKIYNSNGPTLLAALAELGIETFEKWASDNEDSLKSEFSSIESDVLITVGAVSAGDFDLVPKVLKNLGAKIIFHKLAIKPGKPLLFATMDRAHQKPLIIFGLPGNPVSALVVFDQFIRPGLLKMMGSSSPLRQRYLATAETSFKGTPEKEDFLRAVVSFKENQFFVHSAGKQGSANLKALSAANAWVILPPDCTNVKPGDKISVEILEAL